MSEDNITFYEILLSLIKAKDIGARPQKRIIWKSRAYNLQKTDGAVSGLIWTTQ